MPLPFKVDLPSLRAAYADGSATPSDVIKAVHAAISQEDGMFIYIPPLGDLLKQCKDLEAQKKEDRGTLWGVPFAVKDNVEVAGMPITSACPDYKYDAPKTASAVEELVKAGAIVVGKTNMDQFASGLVGTRTPYGTAVNAFDYRFVPGGSSSGSGAAVGSGLVSFAIGTDTAGSGRIPAGFNGCVGIKPTVGSISTSGLIPACASLDCLSVFAATVADGVEVARIMRGGSPGRGADRWRRDPPSPPPTVPFERFRFGVPSADFLDWSGPGGAECQAQYQQQFERAVSLLQGVGGVKVDIDFAPFAQAAAELYGGAFIAERFSGLRAFLDKGLPAPSSLSHQLSLKDDPRLLPVTRHIISLAGKFTATDLFDDIASMAGLKARAAAELAKVDLLLVPTALHHYTVEEIREEESGEGGKAPTWHRNAKLGRFTNFVNLLDMCGVAVPCGVVRYDAAVVPEGSSAEVSQRAAFLSRSPGPTTLSLPFGVTLLAPAWMDEWVGGVAAALQDAAGVTCGPGGHRVEPVLPPSEGEPAAKKVKA